MKIMCILFSNLISGTDPLPVHMPISYDKRSEDTFKSIHEQTVINNTDERQSVLLFHLYDGDNAFVCSRVDRKSGLYHVILQTDVVELFTCFPLIFLIPLVLLICTWSQCPVVTEMGWLRCLWLVCTPSPPMCSVFWSVGVPICIWPIHVGMPQRTTRSISPMCLQF